MARKKDKRAARRDAELEREEGWTSLPSPPPSPTSIPSNPHLIDGGTEEAMSLSRLPLLICSIGNPHPTYTGTLHSAGHTALLGLHALVRHSGIKCTDFEREKDMGGGLVSYPVLGSRLGWRGLRPGKSVREGAKYTGNEGSQEEMWTWWQSTRFMNESGKGFAEAVKRWRWSLGEANVPADIVARAQVVVLHDELEKPVGKYIVRREKSSLKGHNGLKSVNQAFGGANFIRIGIGIGRPESRNSADVSRHVLRKMTAKEFDEMDGTIPAILEELRDIAEGK